MPQTLVDHGETLREREMWERFEMDGFEQVGSSCKDDEDVDEEAQIDATLRSRLETINLGTVGLTEPSSPYDDGDETITNIMRNFGDTFNPYWQLCREYLKIIGPSDNDTKQLFQAAEHTPNVAHTSPEWFPYPSKIVHSPSHLVSFVSSICPDVPPGCTR